MERVGGSKQALCAWLGELRTYQLNRVEGLLMRIDLIDAAARKPLWLARFAFDPHIHRQWSSHQ